jgi:hypothetical protein
VYYELKLGFIMYECIYKKNVLEKKGTLLFNKISLLFHFVNDLTEVKIRMNIYNIYRLKKFYTRLRSNVVSETPPVFARLML